MPGVIVYIDGTPTSPASPSILENVAKAVEMKIAFPAVSVIRFQSP